VCPGLARPKEEGPESGGTSYPSVRRLMSLAWVRKGVVVMMWWDGGHWYWGIAMMIVFWGAIVAIVYLAARGSRNDAASRPNAHELLDERFAKGELSEEEYELKRAALEGRPTTVPH